MSNFPRTIRSFVRREGRLTDSQKRALEQLWPGYGLEYEPNPWDLDQVFGRRATRTLEIGFGNGTSLAKQAAANPERDFLGIEVHRPGVGHLLIEIEKRELKNVRISNHDGIEVLQDQIRDASFDTVQLFFPDPWPKKRHHKRRIVQNEFVQRIYRILTPGGLFHVATDWEPYTEHVLEIMSQQTGFQNLSKTGFVPRPDSRPLTKFENRGLRRGHGVWDMQFRKT